MAKKVSNKAGLQEIFFNKIVNEVIKPKKDSGFRVLVLDNYCTKLISGCVKTYDIIEQNIAVMELLERKRKPFPELEVIYMIKPNTDTIDLIIEDFTMNKNEKKTDESKEKEESKEENKKKQLKLGCLTKMYNKFVYGTDQKTTDDIELQQEIINSRYKCGHINFVGLCSPNLMNHLKITIGSFIKSYNHINIDYYPIERQVFSFNTPDTFKYFYTDKNDINKKDHLDSLAEKIATVCASLDEYPSIRFKKTQKVNDLAIMVKQKLDILRDKNSSLGKGEGKNRSQLLILDRSFDPVSPLLHEFTYQCMAYDLVEKIDKNKQAYEENVLDENDDLWVELRHKHVAETRTLLTEQFKKFKNLHSKATQSGLSVQELGQLVKKMPQFKKEIDKYTLHLGLTDECFLYYDEKRIKMSKFEQVVAMGHDVNGETVKDFTKDMVDLLMDDEFDKNDKLRLLMLFLLHKNGILEKNIETYLKHAEIADKKKEKAIYNMSKIGLEIIKDSGFPNTNIDRSNKRERPYQYEVSRWTPLVKDLIEDIIEGKLNKVKFPSLTEGQESGMAAYGGVSARVGVSGGLAIGKQCPRLIVFIIGGITYSEMRSAYEVQEKNNNWQIFIGSNELITPVDFLNNLSNI